MLRKTAFLLWALVTTFLLSVSASAADLKVASLNALHLGWGSATNNQNKCTQINYIMSNVDILLVQESMTKNSDFQCSAGLASGIGYNCYGVQGATSYKEAYCFVYKKAKITITSTKTATNYAYSRPPYAILAKVTLSSTNIKYMWFANIHSVFGKTITPRQNEAAAAGVFFNSLLSLTSGSIPIPAKGFPVLIGGDWNLPVIDKAKGTYVPGFTWADPTVSTVSTPESCPTTDPTSLTTAGAPSSPYDHFVITGVSLSAATACAISVNPLTGSNWRKQVSDHMAIYWELNFK